MNDILRIGKYTNNYMKLKWSNYELAKSFDEYINSDNKVRGHIRKIGNFFESLSLTELQELNSSTESAIKSLGINFRVYSDTGSEERSWPLDFIPRLIKKKEWDQVSKGLIQRTKALNLFIEDCYNEQKFLKQSSMNEDLILKSKAYFSFCKNVKLPNSAWSHICGSDLIKDIKGDFYVLEDFGDKILTDPIGKQYGRTHVVRGSNYKSSSISELRLTYRDSSSGPDDLIGFRIGRWLLGKE